MLYTPGQSQRTGHKDKSSCGICCSWNAKVSNSWDIGLGLGLCISCNTDGSWNTARENGRSSNDQRSPHIRNLTRKSHILQDTHRIAFEGCFPRNHPDKQDSTFYQRPTGDRLCRIMCRQLSLCSVDNLLNKISMSCCLFCWSRSQDMWHNRSSGWTCRKRCLRNYCIVCSKVQNRLCISCGKVGTLHSPHRHKNRSHMHILLRFLRCGVLQSHSADSCLRWLLSRLHKNSDKVGRLGHFLDCNGRKSRHSSCWSIHHKLLRSWGGAS